jgi:type VI secretion system protein ImpC
MAPEDRSGGISAFGVGFGEPKGPSAGTQEEHAFRIAVIAEVVPSADWSTGRTPPLDPLPIDAQTFDQVMAALAPSLAIDVPDPFDLPGERPLRIDIVLKDRKALRPNDVVDQVPALRALAEARRVVRDVTTRKISAETAHAQLARILPRPSWADALVREVRSVGIAPERPAAPAASTSGPPSEGAGLASLLDMVDVSAPTENEPPKGGGESDASRFVAVFAEGTRSGRAGRAVVGTAPERLELAFRNLVESIIHHAEFRRLESTWRGLRLLAEHADRKVGVEIDILCAGRDAVTDALRRIGEPDETRPPVDLIVIDQRIEPVARDLGLLEQWAGLAADLMAPIVLAGHPGMLGVDSLDRVARTTSSLSTSEDGRAVAVRGVASREASRWVMLVLNDPLVRAAYTPETSRLKEPPFEEDASDVAAHVFANGAYVVGALCVESYARSGWGTAIVGGRDGVIGNLPVRTISDRGIEAAICLEVLPVEDGVKEAARAGLALLACAANGDAAILSRAPVLNRTGGGGGATTSTLPDQLFVGRFGRAVQQIAAAIPAGTDPQKIEEVARIALAELFSRAAPSGPELIVKVDAAHSALTVTVRPRRFAGVSMEELTLGAALG